MRVVDRSLPLTTDLDDCALDWTGGFRGATEIALGRPLPPANHSWDLSDWLGVDNPLDYIHAFNTSEAFGRLALLACARAVLTAAAEAGHPLIAITACSEDAASHRLRLANIKATLGDILTDVRFVPLGGDKTTHLRAVRDAYGQAGVWVEDNPKNAIAGADLGFDTFVRRQPHNRAFEASCTDARLTWMDDYHAVGAHLGLNLQAA